MNAGLSTPDPPNRAPDPERVGGLDWARRTNGNLTPRERRRLLGASALAQYHVLARALRVAFGLATRTPAPDPMMLAPPDSRLARHAEEICRTLSAALEQHSYRTWRFGAALCALDGVALDAELLYASALLHDVGLAAPMLGRCFTLAGAEAAVQAAERSGLEDVRAGVLADAICAHISPDMSVARHGALAAYLQAGALLDLTGIRAWDLSRNSRDAVVAEHPRRGLKRELVDRWRAESLAVPAGRAALLRRCGFLVAVSHAPYPQ